MSEVPLYAGNTLDPSDEYGGTSLIRKRPPPQDHPRTLGIVLR